MSQDEAEDAALLSCLQASARPGGKGAQHSVQAPLLSMPSTCVSSTTPSSMASGSASEGSGGSVCGDGGGGFGPP